MVAVCVGLVWRDFEVSQEIVSRTKVGFGNAVLAFASGVAAVLSITKGTQAVLVGVMVAVALIPPLATAGLLLGSGQYFASLGAILLLAINVAARLAALNARKRTLGLAVVSLVLLVCLIWVANITGLDI